MFGRTDKLEGLVGRFDSILVRSGLKQKKDTRAVSN